VGSPTRNHGGGRRNRGALGLAVSLLASLVWMPSGGALDSGTPPVHEATLGGPLHAEMYPSGMEIAPDGSVIVADTGNNQVAKYTAEGTQVWRIGRHGSASGQFDNPRDAGVDGDGNVYVADSRNNRIVKLSPAGTWLATFGGPTGDTISFPLGVSVSNNKVYVADTGKNKIRVFSTSGALQLSVAAATGTCAFSAPRDVDADAAGNIYLANYKVNNVVKFTGTGSCVTAWGSTGTGDGQFRALYGVRLATDPVLGTQAVYIADANNNRVQEFRTDGTFVAAIGSPGPATTPGTFFQLRRVAVAPDGDVWGADLWGWRVVRFDRTPTGYTYAQTIGPVIPATTNTAVFQEPRGIAFDSAGVITVADTVHHRIVRMNPDGTILSTCGKRGSAAGEFNWPRGVAVDQATGEIWVANTKQYNLHIIRPDCSAITKFGVFGTAGDQFNWPYSIVIRQSDRTAWVADTLNHRIKVYDVATRALIGMFGAKGAGTGQFNEPSGIAVNSANGRILIADARNNRVVELSDNHGTGVAVARTLTGGFNRPQGVATDSNGHIFVADSENNQVAVLSQVEGVVTARFSNPSGLDEPQNVAVDASGRLLVADTYHDRIQRYQPYTVVSTPDTTAPASTISAPTKNQVLPNAPVSIAGTATDNVGVTAVRVAIKNIGTGLWWRGGNSWGAFLLVDATVAAPGTASTGWTLSWTPPAGAGSYGVQSEAADGAGNRQPAPKPWVPFRVTG
jgi:DNA-binding beta-propeller fold protein YncE